ncbi:DUF3465 domain-containing protein [Neisseria iguanae]|uniref:DUF3465 domain-containing protein n=1 Tax=Neisseria iguanae TaxID=90242 RepID=A0A2P7TXS9_9NEIS|nr:DUF3465 domain-containing protein [Neisseria iguanae]PSJ79495.1 hypothetical protein C7N83_11855 [Neisseria iguanae]
MNKWIWIAVAAAAFFGYQKWQDTAQELPHGQMQSRPSEKSRQRSGTHPSSGNAEAVLQRAFEEQRNNLQIEGEGVVKKTLPDDNKGSRHQRFILKLSGGQTLLVAHNIDLADKIKGLKKGDTVRFYGVYEWSAQGGVIHWTHHDPQGRHIDGWLKHNGKIYQ